MPYSNLETRKFKNISIAELAFPAREGGYSKGHETREQILSAALHLLVEEGYGALTMRRIAAACGLRIGNLTYHFATREELIRALLDALIRAYEIEFDAILQFTDELPEERLAEVCGLILEDIRTKKTTHVFPELWALANHDRFVLERVQELYTRARRSLLDIVAEMRPDLDPQGRENLALFISASMEGLTVFAGYEKPFEGQMGELERIAIQSFLQIVKTYRRTQT
ncbi:TetR/AcrR family transcriptional regulator [Erythrobacter tepidarius]|uniref:TetR/AcrR family transcriptional regulator n=1 Tax=Erythrobacter tepidarius TaxID=60454 RepID=UPI000A3B93FB|nr:TetR/AcrR family transcriptional regulator [Erythrobacter tepidarius]